ncbi:MAG TPA: hypothetical protein VGZ22_24115 [Isosphaeraceae bacterium]|jgi:hypothetical protein|nr:hypothetical protein [Isosphaeraceae bacterium]
MTRDDFEPRLCQRCGCGLTPGRGDFYVISILAVADPSPPLLEEESDVAAEIKRLVQQMRGMPEENLMDQVYRRAVLYLCSSCYRDWIIDPTHAS